MSIDRRRLRLLALAALLSKRAKRRKVWTQRFFRPSERRSHGEYYRTFLNIKQNISKEGYPEKFFEYTRMHLREWERLYGLLKERLTKQSIRTPISAEERLVVTICYFATGASFRRLALTFRISHNLISGIVSQVSLAIWEILQPIYLRTPQTGAEWLNISQQFAATWNAPLCLGCIDGKHCRVKKPIHSGSLYCNFKDTLSIVLLAVCDYRCRLLYVDIGGLGHESDARLFSNSDFRKGVENGLFNLPDKGILPNTDTSINYYFVGDNAFPLEVWLQKPYKGYTLTKEQRIYNYRISRARNRIENTFGILAAKWRLLQKEIETTPEHATDTVKALACLHNFLIDESDWRNNPLRMTDSPDQQDGTWRAFVPNPMRSVQMVPAHSSRNKMAADDMRVALMNFFNGPGAVHWQNRCLE